MATPARNRDPGRGRRASKDGLLWRRAEIPAAAEDARTMSEILASIRRIMGGAAIDHAADALEAAEGDPPPAAAPTPEPGAARRPGVVRGRRAAPGDAADAAPAVTLDALTAELMRDLALKPTVAGEAPAPEPAAPEPAAIAPETAVSDRPASETSLEDAAPVDAPEDAPTQERAEAAAPSAEMDAWRAFAELLVDETFYEVLEEPDPPHSAREPEPDAPASAASEAVFALGPVTASAAPAAGETLFDGAPRRATPPASIPPPPIEPAAPPAPVAAPEAVASPFAAPSAAARRPSPSGPRLRAQRSDPRNRSILDKIAAQIKTLALERLQQGVHSLNRPPPQREIAEFLGIDGAPRLTAGSADAPLELTPTMRAPALDPNAAAAQDALLNAASRDAALQALTALSDPAGPAAQSLLQAATEAQEAGAEAGLDDRDLDALTRETLKPILAAWLREQLPGLVAEIVREEMRRTEA